MGLRFRPMPGKKLPAPVTSYNPRTPSNDGVHGRLAFLLTHFYKPFSMSICAPVSFFMALRGKILRNHPFFPLKSATSL